MINCLHRLKQSIIGEWNSKEIFVVGETTGLIVADKLKLKHKGSSSGSLNSLINDFISAGTYLCRSKTNNKRCRNVLFQLDNDTLNVEIIGYRI